MIIDWIANSENLYWAWEKVKEFYRESNIWFDQIELSEFEAKLQSELRVIQKRLLERRYELLPLKPIALPKASNENGQPQSRQSFWVSIPDQVAWVAVVNIIGPVLDSKMSFWSYGHRLYKSVFYEEERSSKQKELKFGPYRNSRKKVYVKWTHSWPLYRKHIAITSKIFGHQEKFLKEFNKFADEDLEDETQKKILEQNVKLQKGLRNAYLDVEYWDKKLSGEIYWASVDFTKFYPTVNLETIKHNIEHYLGDYYSADFGVLLNDLLTFHIDSSGWKQDELELIHLGKIDGSRGIPTGLIVDGFLANIALMEIDQIINNKLIESKQIAHFRFVDDHVFLADDFDRLHKWIIEYMQLLEDQQVGTTINSLKTQPKSLSILISGGEEHSNYDQALKDARRDAKLDPDFPSPVMTPTLTKVSNIARTQFDFLDHQEQEQLLSDLEHLLVTDFPEHELRKATRLSFSARMLSKLAPKVDSDISELYAVEEEIFALEDEKENIRETLGNEKWKEILVEIDISLGLLNERKAIIEKKLESDDIHRIKRVKKLISKAIYENYDKLTLWSSLISFLQKSGSSDVKAVFELLETIVATGKLNNLSNEYICSYILQTIVHSLITACKVIANPQSSFVQKKRARTFLMGVKKIDFRQVINIQNKKYYSTQGIELFGYAWDSIFILLSDIREEADFVKQIHKNILADYAFADWPQPYKKTNKSRYGFSSYAWWILQKTIDRTSFSPNQVWKRISEELDFSDDVSWTIISLYPKYLQISHLDNMFESENKYEEQEGWLYDIQIGLENRKIDYTNNVLKKYQLIVENDRRNKKYITLFEWVDWARRRYDEIIHNEYDHEEFGSFDPRISEWTAIEIVKQVAKNFGAVGQGMSHDLFGLNIDEDEDYLTQIHPSNYLIPRSWIKEKQVRLTWDQWYSKIAEEKIGLKDKSRLITDSRYTPDFKDPGGVTNPELSAISALGKLLIGLLARNFDFFPLANPSNIHREYNNILVLKLEGCSISSWTHAIINACLSGKNRENKFVRVYQDSLLYDSDTVYDPPEIDTLEKLISFLKKAQGVLEKFQITVQNHQPRQLIPISLKQLTSTYDPYTEDDSTD